MFRKLSDFFYRTITRRILLLFAVLYSIIGFGIMPYKTIKMQQQYGENLQPFDLTFGYDKNFADNFLSALGENGRAEYMQFVGVFDTIYPIIYGGLLLSVLTFLIGGSKYKNKINLLNLLPVLIVLVDYGENICSIYNTTHFPDYSLLLLTAGSICTQVKWTLVVLVLLFIFYLGIIRFKDRHKITY